MKLYLLTLTYEQNATPIGKILLTDNNIDLIIKGINKIETGNNDGEYYQTYANDINIHGNPKNIYGGTYRDTLRWAKMSWDIDEIETIS